MSGGAERAQDVRKWHRDREPLKTKRRLRLLGAVKSRADRNYGRGDALATGACGNNYATVDALQGHSHRGNSTESQIEPRLRFPLKVGAEDRRQ